MRVATTFTRLDERAQAPCQAHPGEDAGWDLAALENVDINHDGNGKPVATWIRTGIAVAIPRGHYGRIVGRSSTASKGLHVIEGIIDSGYRGELLVRVCPIWHGEPVSAVRVPAGQALAQLIVSPVPDVDMVEVGNLSESARGENGFGSSDQQEPRAFAQIRAYTEGAKRSEHTVDEEEQIFVGKPPCRRCDSTEWGWISAHGGFGCSVCSTLESPEEGWRSGAKYEAQRALLSDGLEFTPPVDPVARDLFVWWMHTAFDDFMATVPKMLEYGGHDGKKGSADLRIIGEGLMELMGWEVTEDTSRVAQELGCWFYDLGKGGRLVSDFQQRRPGKNDTWFDKSIYAMMARRIQEVGSWP